MAVWKIPPLQEIIPGFDLFWAARVFDDRSLSRLHQTGPKSELKFVLPHRWQFRQGQTGPNL